ncbi:MAG: RimK/LysX family protein [Phycisphaerales bacterium]
MAVPSDNKVTLGWREHVALPAWGVGRVRAKIDTGARTSAIHVGEIEELANGHIKFEVVVRERPTRKTVWIDAEPVVREATVKPSSGDRQQRPVVKTTMILGGVEREIELSLVCRKGMLCRMLIGRTALDGVFLVDPSHKYITGKPGSKKKSGAKSRDKSGGKGGRP